MENNTINVTRSAAIGGAVGAGVGALTNLHLQKTILKNPDEFLTQIKGQVAKQRNFANEFHQGTKEAADLANAKLDTFVKNAEEYIKAGKVNVKGVAKNAIAVGAIGAALVGTFALIHNACKKAVKNNAQTAADEFKKAQVGEE